MRLYDPILYPFALLYDGITRLRNRLFDIGSKKSVEFTIPTIVVGNLSVGGTGKTPMIEFLIERLIGQYKLATLSRGYGRKTSGVLIAGEHDTALSIGDESFQIFTKYGQNVLVAVGEARIQAIPEIIMEKPETEVVLLDDAYQHRYLKSDFNILLTTFQLPFFKDKILPLGTLREHRKGAIRADVVIMTKCPEDMSEDMKGECRLEISRYTNENCPVFFAGVKYGLPYGVSPSAHKMMGNIILLSGIANNKVLIDHVHSHYNVLEVLEYPDHYRYSINDIQKMVQTFRHHLARSPVILTTEKDMVKLKDLEFNEYLKEIPIFALPIKVDLKHTDEDKLMDMISMTIIEKGYKSEL
ncbi:tetraacyldisaccharide 4'-kinase [Anditalea andensis]|uniref:Tetraacyldisaccharide 4'-kinase n=1 Tax=Anditalea andensis TaxID=1048983 RepID=A0A074KX88_9BACT|nr:tetraacyldisaccharide 4'-kinase [Anditalea andensis]KEO74581.1 lipid-A-disaccharide synthase [Anditalea andensis]